MSYFLLDQAVNYCQMRQAWNMTAVSETHEYHSSSHPDLPDLKNDSARDRRPVAMPRGMLPELNSTLTLTDVTEKWHTESASEIMNCRSDNSTTITQRCAFSWLSSSGMGLYTAKAIEKHFEPFWKKSSSAWEVIDDSEKKTGKFGFQPIKKNDIGATLELDFSSLQAEVRDVTVFFLKSYGPKWENSSVRVDVVNNEEKILGSLRLEGFHNKTTSEMYQEVLQLPKPTTSAKVVFNLLDGSTFKILGIAICR